MKKLFAAIMASVILTGTLQIQASGSENLIAHWDFENINGNTASDTVTKEALADIKASEFNTVNGYFGSTVELNSESGGTIELQRNVYGEMLKGASGITVSSMVKIKNPSAAMEVIIQIPGDGYIGLEFYVRNNMLGCGVRSSEADPYSRVETAFPNDGLWHYAACTVDYPNREAVLYIDGIEAARKTMTSFSEDSYQMNVSKTTSEKMGGVNILTDELKIYKTALTADEVLAYMPPVLWLRPGVREDNVLTDLAGYDNNAAIAAPDYYDAVGIEGSSLAFDSTDNSSVTMSPGGLYRQLDKAPAVTAAFWCRRRQNPSGDRRLIFISTSVNSVCFEVYMRPDGNIRIGGRSAKAGGSYTSTDKYWGANFSGVLTDNDWHFITATLDYSNRKAVLYKDGTLFKEILTPDNSGTNLYLQSPFLDMGPSAGSADTMNPGEIVFDDLKLFKRALSDDEVINLYNESPSALMYFTQDGAVTEPSRLTGDAVLNFMLKAGEHGNTAKIIQVRSNSETGAPESVAVKTYADLQPRYTQDTLPVSIMPGSVLRILTLDKLYNASALRNDIIIN